MTVWKQVAIAIAASRAMRKSTLIFDPGDGFPGKAGMAS